MAECIKCGATLTKSEEADGICYPCERKLSPLELETLKADTLKRLKEKEREILLTTETYPAGLEIIKRLEIVTAECIFGMNILSDFISEVTDIVGGRSGVTQKLFREARKTVLRELREEAFLEGGNAVIGVSIQYSQLSGKGTAMLMVTATGTAVIASNPVR